MTFSKLETQTGFSFLFDLVDSNQDKVFELTFKEGDVILVKFDMAFEDDSSSQDATDLEDNEYHSISFIVEKVIKDISHRYKKDNVIIVNPFDMPKEYKIK